MQKSATVTLTDNFVEDAAKKIVEKIIATLMRQPQCVVSLCGGNTPKPIYKRLAELGRELPWERIFFTFGDERTVPPEHADSNFRMANEAMFETLIEKKLLPKENILRVKGEMNPEEAAKDYEAQLEALWKKISARKIDITLLGMGGDGHTASLFPGTKALEINNRAVVENWVQAQNTWRITMTYATINASAEVLFLVNDAKKNSIISQIVMGEESYPAGRIKADKIEWIVGRY
jgi:6-phosphogluconolactonase